MTSDFGADDLLADPADVLEQRRPVREDDEPETEPPPDEIDPEADPADVQEQLRTVPTEEEDWP